MKPAIILTATAMLFLNGARAADKQTIIETSFAETDSDGRPLTVPAPIDVGELPLRAPTAIEEDPSDASLPTTVRTAETDFGMLKPPYVAFQVGERDDGSGMVANAGVHWDLRKLALDSGVYQISFDMAAKQKDKQGAVFQVVFGSNVPGFNIAEHVNQHPAIVRFVRDGTIFIGGKTTQPGFSSLPYEPDEVYHCVMQIDLDNRTWSLEINGDKLLAKEPFPEFLDRAFVENLSIGRVVFSSQQGLLCDPDAGFILANVKMSKLP